MWETHVKRTSSWIFLFIFSDHFTLPLYGAVSFWNTLCVWILYPLTSSKCCLFSLYRIIIILQSCLHSGLSNHLLLSFAHFAYFSLPSSVFHAWKRLWTEEIKADKVWLHSGARGAPNSLPSMAPGRGIYIWIHLNNFTLTFRTLALLLFPNTYSNGDITIQSLVEQPQRAVMSNPVLTPLSGFAVQMSVMSRVGLIKFGYFSRRFRAKPYAGSVYICLLCDFSLALTTGEEMYISAFVSSLIAA